MITKNYKLSNFKLNYDLKKIAALEDILFLDIETTGFSAKTSAIYMIGVSFYINNEWNIQQWICENDGNAAIANNEINIDEKEMLKIFAQFIKKFRVLIHFNGNQFDLPFISGRCEKYGISVNFDLYTGIDLYKRIFPYRHFLCLSNCKQKSLEEFMGIQREDLYSGGELISVFKSYCSNHDNHAKHLLLKHNKDDVEGMLKLLPILSFIDIQESIFQIDHVEIECSKDIFGKVCKETLIYFNTEIPYPKPIACHANNCYFTGKETKGLIKVPLFEEEMKFFYSDYKNYYYLPLEDTAIHKSVASYVDPAFREQATASNCYTRKKGKYLPQWDSLFTPFFKREYSSKNLFFELTDDFQNNREAFNIYLHHILEMMIATH